MRFLFSIALFLFLSSSIFSQDTLLKTGDSKIYKNGFRYGRNYTYQNKTISDKEMRTVLLNTKNKDIELLIHHSKRAQNLQLIGFAAIPFALGTFLCFRQIKENDTKNNPSHFSGNTNTSESENKNLQIAGGIFFALTVACPLSSIGFKHRRMKFTKQAIDLYNQKY